MKEGGGEDHVSLGIQHPNGTYERPMSAKNLFWVLPGNVLNMSYRGIQIEKVESSNFFNGIGNIECVYYGQLSQILHLVKCF